MKNIVIAACLFFSTSIFASQTLITCPTTLTCNYDAGTCNLPAGQWAVSSGAAIEPFSGSKTMNLSSIDGRIETTNKSILDCWYNYGKNSQISISTPVKKLTGVNWIFSGWGMKYARCQSVIAPNTCAGE